MGTLWVWVWLGLVWGVEAGPQDFRRPPHKHHWCGVDKLDWAPPEEVVEQDYSGAGGQRQLQTAFVTVEDAHSQGMTVNLRTALVWDVVNSGDAGQQCSAVGEVVQGGLVCGADDVLTPGSNKAAILQARLTWASNHLSSLLYVKPVTGGVVMSSSVRSSFPAVSAAYSNVDLVVVVTARPSSEATIAAFASCLQRDQHGRCTVGWLNWSPAFIDEELAGDASVVTAERETAVHELLHVLGAVKPSASFVDDTGSPIMESSIDEGLGIVYTVDDGSGGTDAPVHFLKPTSWIITPRVQAIARQHFGCPTLIGMPLEDVPFAGGAGSHWEARVAGPEVLSYGSAAGEVYLSDLTLAFLEDTEQYRANYTMAGRLVDPQVEPEEPCGGTASTAVLDFVFGNSQRREEVVEPVTRAPGALRWGAGEGCAFVVGSVADWPSRYHCDENQALGCTADYRMSAVCNIVSTWTLPSAASSLGDVRSSLSTAGNPDCPAGVDCPLPPMMRFLVDASGTHLPRTGGYSQAMDFAPVQVGYWNCADDTAQVEPSTADGGTTLNLTQLAPPTPAGAGDLFGGQCRCTQCRCFQSSLREVTSGSIDATVQQLGLCYMFNCYREDYLQVAIRDPFTGSQRWFRCTDGNTLFIPGFTGTFTCPHAVSFCAQEDISGVWHPELALWQLWVVLAVMLGLPFIALVVCLCPCFREPVVRRSKGCCGVTLLARKKTVWVEEGAAPSPRSPVLVRPARDVSSPSAGHIVVHNNGQQEAVLRAELRVRRVRPPRCPGTVLLTVNAATLFASGSVLLCMLVFIAQGSLSVSSSPLLFLTAMLGVVSTMGMAGARKRAYGMSCLVVTYLYAAALVCVIIVVALVSMLAVSTDLQNVVDANWDFFEEIYAGDFDTDVDYDAQVAQVAARVRSHAGVYLLAIASVVAALLVGVYAAGRIMKRHNVAVVTLCVLNHTMVAVGGLLLLAGVLMATTSSLGALADLQAIVGDVIIATFVAGVALVALSGFGVRAALTVNRTQLNVFGGFVAAGCVLGLASTAVSAGNADTAADTVAQLPAEDLADLAMQRTPEQLEADVKLFYTAVSISCGIVSAFWVATLVSLFVFGQAVGLWCVSAADSARAKRRHHRAVGRPSTAEHDRVLGILSSVVPTEYAAVPVTTPKAVSSPMADPHNNPLLDGQR